MRLILRAPPAAALVNRGLGFENCKRVLSNLSFIAIFCKRKPMIFL